MHGVRTHRVSPAFGLQDGEEYKVTVAETVYIFIFLLGSHGFRGTVPLIHRAAPRGLWAVDFGSKTGNN